MNAPTPKLLPALLTAAALLAAGCGGEAGPETVPRAAAALKQAKSADMALVGTIGIAGTGAKLTAEGRVGFATRKSHLRMSIEAVALNDVWTSEIVVDGPTSWIKTTPTLPLLPSGKPWLEYPTTGVRMRKVNHHSLLRLCGVANLAGFVEFLGYASDIRRAEDRFDGDVPRYRATIDVARAAADADDDGLRQHANQLVKQLDVREIPVEVWVNSEGRVRRLRVWIKFALNGHEGQVHFMVEFYNYGTPVAVEPPPADLTFRAVAAARAER